MNFYSVRIGYGTEGTEYEIQADAYVFDGHNHLCFFRGDDEVARFSHWLAVRLMSSEPEDV